MEFLKLLEQLRNPVFDAVFQFFTYFGEELLVIGIVCLLYWCINKKLAYQIGLTFFISGLFLQCMKITFRIPRPWILDPSFQPVSSAVDAATGYSFPSGHTMGAASLFTPLAMNAKKKGQKILFVLLFLIVGFSRMYLGVHTPKDVIAALLLSLVVAFLVNRIIVRISNTAKSNAIIGCVLFLISAGSMAYSLILLNNQTIDAAYAADCCKAAGAGLGFALGWFLERTYINFDTAGRLAAQVVKFLAGIGVALILKIVIKAILGDSIPSEIFQYFILVLWIIALYPYLLVKFKFCDITTEQL